MIVGPLGKVNAISFPQNATVEELEGLKVEDHTANIQQSDRQSSVDRLLVSASCLHTILCYKFN